MRDRQESGRISWLARSLGVLIAGGYQIPEGKPNPAMEQAQVLSFDDIERKLLEAAIAEPVAPKENSVGSFERFMMAMNQLDQRGKMI